MCLKLPERKVTDIEAFILDYGSQQSDGIIDGKDLTKAYTKHIQEIMINKAINSLVDEGKATVKLSEDGDYLVSIHAQDEAENEQSE